MHHHSRTLFLQVDHQIPGNQEKQAYLLLIQGTEHKDLYDQE